MTKIPDRLANLLVATVIVMVPFHAFVTVWASSLVGHFTLLRLWDDTLLLLLFGIVSAWIISDKQLRQLLLRSLLFRLIAGYIFISLALGCVALAKHNVTLTAAAYALLVNLRFFVWLLAVWLASLRRPQLVKRWPKLVFWPMAIVVIFALLQFFVLPPNFLTHFGYSKATTFVPIITINQNTDTIRTQSFLRGTNPLGAYLVMTLGLLAALLMVAWHRNWRYLLVALPITVALGVSFSRSAWIGTFITVMIVAWLGLNNRRSKMLLVTITGALLLIFGSGIAVFRHNHGVQNVFFHVSTDSTAQVTSNANHASALHSGLHDVVRQPFGRGPGTAGPASWYNTPHGGVRNSENYYLEIGQELGWIGLVLFVIINVVLGWELWQRRANPLALGLLAALIGLSVVNQFTYAWSDDTLAFVFWGLAGMALATTPKNPSMV